MVSKIENKENALNDLRFTLNTYESQLPCIQSVLTPEAQILARFALPPTVFATHGCAEMH